jgi:L-seryl-tRNA(Ser) seleniumtransferase
LVAVGTTNRTRIGDYRKAITDNTGVLMTAHTSNYRVQGFTEDVGLAELVELGREFQLPVVYDLGGGILKDWSEWGLPSEPVAADSLRQGVSVVTFSGDKVLGGPQAGLIAGDKDIIQQVRRNPLMRALRCDKVTLAALEATLRLYLSPDLYRRQIPAWRMLTEPVDEVRERAEALANDLRKLDGADLFDIEIRDTRSQAGSGTMPLETLPSVAVTIIPRKGSVEKVARRFGGADVPVIGYVKDDTFFLDLKTVTMQEIAVLVEQAASVFSSF